jgi:hypothetical protein
MVSSCCGGGRCYCAVIGIGGITVEGSGGAGDPYVISGGGGGGGHFYYAEDYTEPGDPDPDDWTEPIQAMIDAAHAVGGGTWVIWRQYPFEGQINIRGGVCVYQLAMPQLESPAQEEIGLKATGPDAQVMYGQGGAGGSTNDNPGEIRNLYVEGDHIGGDGDALFVCDASNTALYNLHVRNSAGHGIDVGSSQNLVFYNIHAAGSDSGTALLFKSRSIGRQGPGGNKIYGGHVGDSYLPIHVTSNDPTDFFPPHDNIIEGVLFETGRLAANAVIRANGVFEAGETVLRSCVATSGVQVTENELDCCYYVDNPIFEGFSTILTLDSCYIGGGAGAVKATDGIRILQTNAYNEVRLYGRTNVANVDYLFNVDGTHLGAGSDALASVHGPLVEVTAGIELFRLTNGAGTSGAWTGFVDVRVTPLRFIVPTGLGSVFQTRREGDVANRLQIDRDGNIRAGDGTGVLTAQFLNNVTGWIINGKTVVQIADYTTATRPNPVSLPNRLIIDTDIDSLMFSDGATWIEVGSGGGGGSAYTPVTANITGAAYVVDPTAGTNWYLTATGSGTVISLDAGAVNGDAVEVQVKQDATGSRTYSFPGTYKGIGDISPSTAANSIDVYAIWKDPFGTHITQAQAGV